MPESQDIIDYLVAHGAYVEASRQCVERGDLARAIRLLERVWQFSDAIPLAMTMGDRPLAVRLSLDAGLPERAAEIAALIADDAPAELTAAADAFASRGRYYEAARAAERAADLAGAAAHYRRAGANLDAARILELAGDHHQAGVIYEGLVQHGTADEAAAARLALGRLLGRLGHHQDAARLLQVAARHPQHRHAASRALCGELLGLGFREAATEVLSRLRQEAPELPPSPEAFVEVERSATVVEGPAGRGVGVDIGLLRRRFRIAKMLGGGATARVYQAEDTLLGRPVAVKLLAIGAGGTGAERKAYQRFAREAEAAGRLRHPNIVTLYDFDEAQGLFVLELMTGGTLADRLLANGPLTPAAARRLALDLLAALGAAHERGIVHRDVKPANIFFDAAGNAKLSDFGAAHLIDFGQTQTGGLIGTLATMSPEQISGSPISFAADLYALGVTLFEALTGRPPFLGPDIVAQHLSEPPAAPSALRPGLGDEHDQVLRRALAKAPTGRYPSAESMAEAIRRWPTESTLGVAGAAAAPASAPPVMAGDLDPLADAAADAAVDVGHEFARTAQGTLSLARDPRVGRPVLRDSRTQPISDDELARLRLLAAAGGPHVQRILEIATDRRLVVYEAIPGPAFPVDDLPPDERARLAPLLAELQTMGAVAPPLAAARTDGGVVLLLAPPLPAGAALP
ncbi:MAG TPA: serine/threonine-protein kinase [Polyangia bacterium]|nr:serine/threonine-protein kinase [Polyangia bacterium]